MTTIDHEALSQVVFATRYTVPASQTAVALFRALPHARFGAEHMVEAMATAYLIGVLESLCICALREHIDEDAHVVVGVGVHCRHSAPIPPGAELQVSGWVEGIDGRELTFRVQACDELEPVGDASIRVAIVERGRMTGTLARKRAAVARRELYACA